MSRIDKLIASMPSKMANAVIHQRKLHACLMELTANKSREVAARAIFLNYQDGNTEYTAVSGDKRQEYAQCLIQCRRNFLKDDFYHLYQRCDNQDKRDSLQVC